MKDTLLGTALLIGATGAFAGSEHNAVEHVLIVSVDGMHAQDLARCIADNGTLPTAS